MFNAYALMPDGHAETFTSLETLRPHGGRPGVRLWVDLENPGDAEMVAIGELFHLDPSAVDDCLRGAQRPRIDEFEKTIFLVLYGAISTEDATFSPRKLAVFCHLDFLITVHREPLRSVRAVRERCSRHAAQTLSRGVGYVLYAIIDNLVDNYLLLTEAYESRLDELEEASLGTRVDGHLLEQLIPVRRELVELRRFSVSLREVLTPLARDEYGVIADALEPRFDHVLDHLVSVVEVIDGQREILHAILENYRAALAHRANQIMRALTVFATALLPMSVMAGIYGMNLPVWPPSDHPWSFWGVLAAMFTVAGSTLLLFRRWRLW